MRTWLGRSIKWLIVAGAVGGASASAWRWGPRLYERWSGADAAKSRRDQAQYAPARRQDLRIVIPEDGRLRAIKYHSIYSQLRGAARITFLAPDGGMVKKGDKVVEFEKKLLEDQLRLKGADVETTQRAIAQAEDACKIQESSAKSAVAAADTKLGDAEVALRVFQNLEGPKKLSDLDAAITDARTKYDTAVKSLGEIRKRLEDQLFEEEQRKAIERELTAAKDSGTALRKMLDNLTLQKKTFRRYDYPQTLRTRQLGLENAKLEVEKARVMAAGEVRQKKEELAKHKDALQRLTTEVAELKEDIAKCILTAPADGMVIYGDPNMNMYRYYGGESGLRVGMDWMGNNLMMTIPEPGRFEVVVNISEDHRSKVTAECRTTVTLPAVPGLVLEGQIKQVSSAASSRSPWDPSSPKTFEAVVSLDKADARMVSGMTARAEILAEVICGALAVPIEAVLNENGQTVCYVREGAAAQRRPVKPGSSNDHFVQILDGLAEGEEVLLTPQQGAEAAAKPG